MFWLHCRNDIKIKQNIISYDKCRTFPNTPYTKSQKQENEQDDDIQGLLDSILGGLHIW